MTSQKKNFQAVIFDMDGLMLNTERLGKTAWINAAKTHGYELPDEIFMEMVGRNKTASDQVLIDYFGPDFPADKVRAHRRSIGHDVSEIKTQPGLLALLQHLKKHNIARAVATSSDYDIAISHLKHTEIFDYFNEIVTGNMVMRSKPAPDIFLEAAKRLKVSTKNCIILEDSESGIQAAAAAEAIPIMVPDLKQPSNEIRKLTYAVCKSLTEALALIEKDFSYVAPEQSL